MRAYGEAVQDIYGYKGIGACGDCLMYDSAGNCVGWDTSSCDSPAPGTMGPPPLSTTSSTGATTTANILGDVNALSSAFANIFKSIQPLPSGCTQVAGPYGISTQCNNNAAGLPLSLSALGAGGSSSILLLGGAALVLILMLKK